MKRNRTRRDTSLNVWPSFTDLITSIFIFAMFLLILMVVQNYISLVQLSHLHRIVGSIFNDLDDLKRVMEGEEVEVEKGTIVIKSDVLFPFNRWEIRDIPSRALEDLRRIGQKLKTYLDSRRSQKFRIVIEGHTDTMGPSENNDRLSYQRAQSLALLWRRNIGFTPEHYELIPAGFGSVQPQNRSQKRYDHHLQRCVFTFGDVGWRAHSPFCTRGLGKYWADTEGSTATRWKIRHSHQSANRHLDGFRSFRQARLVARVALAKYWPHAGIL